MRGEAQRPLHVGRSLYQVGGAELALQERHQGIANRAADRHAQQAERQMIDRIASGLRARVHDLSRQIELRSRPWDWFDPAYRLLPSDQAAVARIEVLGAVDDIRHRPVAALHAASAGFLIDRCLANTVAGQNAVVDPLNLRARIEVRINEIDDVRKQDVASEIAARQQQSRCDPGTALGPACNGRRIEQGLPEFAADDIKIRDARQMFDAELTVGRYNQLNRTLDARP